MGEAPDPAAGEAGRLLFARECRFVSGAALAAQLPADTLPEVAAAVLRPDPVVDEKVAAAGAEASQTGARTGNVTTPQIDTDPRPSTERPVPSEKVAPPSARLAFGDRVDVQKPLDEVILEYLVEKARERSSDRRAPPKSRSKG